MTAPGDNAAPIIIRRRKVIKAGGHHGGAWKVAYADFVTAMMAFFLLMWLLNATTEKQRKGIADYFSPTIPINRISGGGDGDFGGDSLFSENSLAYNGVGGSRRAVSEEERNRGDLGLSGEGAEGAPEPNRPSAEPAGEFAAVSEHLQGRSGESEVSAQMLRHMRTRVTDEGLIIELFDLDGAPLFDPDTAETTPLLRDLAALVASAAGLVTNGVAVEAHTRARPIVAAENPAWNLSAARANAMRALLEEQKLETGRLRRVTGHADREPAITNPLAIRNNRIEVILLRSDTPRE
ncbi:flagellar motor protein MotB [Roseovarius amoyensis]|uniref:flagellar motor protein MotB n=1 Tax=Roseovarius amoyensis TaxID=2211448 RepID=UPI000DBE4249|nr:flagellar motor protein MotB [Roseovarius amoyensis]